MTLKKILLLGDGNVAVELANALEGKGLQVHSYLHDGPMPDGNEKVFEYLNGQYETLPMTQYETVVLAFTSNRSVQRQIVQELEWRVGRETLFLVSAMAYSATEIASWFEHPERVVGFGFLPPLDEVKLLEVASALQTDALFAKRALSFFAELDKETATVRDSAGLVLPRMVSMIINEAATAVTERIASVEDIDIAMKLGTNYPHGPLEWADRIGLDQVLATLVGVCEEQGEDRYRPAPLLRRMVLARQLGVRTGKGFYIYEGVEEHA